MRRFRQGMSIQEVVNMPGTVKVLDTFEARRVSDNALYRVVIFECGEYAGDVHFLNDTPRVRNCLKQSGLEALSFIKHRFWPLASAIGSVSNIGHLHKFDPIAQDLSHV